MTPFLFLYVLGYLGLAASYSPNEFTSLRRPILDATEDELLQLADYPDNWFTQILDHFNPQDTRTWKQRYVVDERYVKEERDVAFLYVGGESKLDPWVIQIGPWADRIKEFKAISFALEHRYYGDSHPTEDLSLKNLQYLTTQNALADIATFIEEINVQYNLSSNVKWILHGGSYPGELAAWARLKYPHLVHAALASSAPLPSVLDYKEYIDVVYKDLKDTSQSCVDAIGTAISSIEELLKTTSGQKKFQEIFKLCVPLKDTNEDALNVFYLFSTIANGFGYLAQYNNQLGSNRTLQSICNIMTDKSKGTELERLAIVDGDTVVEDCQTYDYRSYITQQMDTTWESATAVSGQRQYTYQTCTEWGLFLTTETEPYIFGKRITLDKSARLCEELFGYNISFIRAAAARENTHYGGVDIEVTNVLFVNGDVDPWSPLGVLTTKNKDSPAIYIKGASHCQDMQAARKSDPAELTAAREAIKKEIGKWLTQ